MIGNAMRWAGQRRVEQFPMGNEVGVMRVNSFVKTCVYCCVLVLPCNCVQFGIIQQGEYQQHI